MQVDWILRRKIDEYEVNGCTENSMSTRRLVHRRTKLMSTMLKDSQKTREYETTGVQTKKTDEYEMTSAQKKIDAYMLMDSQKTREYET